MPLRTVWRQRLHVLTYKTCSVSTRVCLCDFEAEPLSAVDGDSKADVPSAVCDSKADPPPLEVAAEDSKADPLPGDGEVLEARERDSLLHAPTLIMGETQELADGQPVEQAQVGACWV